MAKAVAHALTSDKPKTRYLVGHGGRQTQVAAALPDRVRDRALVLELGLPEPEKTTHGYQTGGQGVNTETKPKVLVVYFSLTKQSRARVAEAMTRAFTARGCDVSGARIEFTDKRWMPKPARSSR